MVTMTTRRVEEGEMNAKALKMNLPVGRVVCIGRTCAFNVGDDAAQMSGSTMAGNLLGLEGFLLA